MVNGKIVDNSAINYYRDNTKDMYGIRRVHNGQTRTELGKSRNGHGFNVQRQINNEVPSLSRRPRGAVPPLVSRPPARGTVAGTVAGAVAGAVATPPVRTRNLPTAFSFNNWFQDPFFSDMAKPIVDPRSVPKIEEIE